MSWSAALSSFLSAAVITFFMSARIDEQKVMLHGLQSEAVLRGFAQYCPTNGEWAWKGECK